MAGWVSVFDKRGIRSIQVMSEAFVITDNDYHLVKTSGKMGIAPVESDRGDVLPRWMGA